MSLIITYANRKEVWYIGQPPPISNIHYSLIEEIQADGDELGYIIQRFANIPIYRVDKLRPDNIARGYVMNWFGDHAKFITANLL